MTIDEAKKVALICETADGGCSVCVKGLAGKLQNTFPEFQWLFLEDRGDCRISVRSRKGVVI